MSGRAVGVCGVIARKTLSLSQFVRTLTSSATGRINRFADAEHRDRQAVEFDVHTQHDIENSSAWSFSHLEKIDLSPVPFR